jgi:hypothetical protein
MEIVEIMREIRSLPDDQLLALAAQVDEVAARAMDRRFEHIVRDGHFPDLANEAQREDNHRSAGLVEEMTGSCTLRSPHPGTDPLYDSLMAKYIR